MRIAIATDWFAPRQGGIEAQLLALAERLAGRGHDVTVLTSTPHAAPGSGYSVRTFDGLRIPGTAVIAAPKLLRDLRRAVAGFDVVHAHVSVVSPLGYGAAVAAATQRIPTVVTFHSVLRLKRVVLALVNAVARLDRAAVIWTAVSDLVGSQVGRALGTGVVVLPNGLDLDFWRAGRARTSPPVADVVTFVSAMRMHRKKRPRALLRAFERAVLHTGLPARLILTGAGPELAALRADAERLDASAAKRVEFRGWQTAAALRDLYHESDAFVMPSRHEAFGIAALEARAAGLPVIASRAAGCREFLRDDETALLFADDAGLADAMARLLALPGLRQRLAAGRDDLGPYDWGRVIDKHERTYRAAVTRAGVAAPSAVPA